MKIGGKANFASRLAKAGWMFTLHNCLGSTSISSWSDHTHGLWKYHWELRLKPFTR